MTTSKAVEELRDRNALQALSFRELRDANRARQVLWCPDPKNQPDLCFRATELAGEVGEACNEVKKLERARHGWRGSRTTYTRLAEELADVVICADLLATAAGIDLGTAVRTKFNNTSTDQGFDVMI
jgi:NTP pyrophosphatase (non-canonical NTP hydrolase)